MSTHLREIKQHGSGIAFNCKMSQNAFHSVAVGDFHLFFIQHYGLLEAWLARAKVRFLINIIYNISPLRVPNFLHPALSGLTPTGICTGRCVRALWKSARGQKITVYSWPRLDLVIYMRGEWVALSFSGWTSYPVVCNVCTFDSLIWIINRPLHRVLGFWACLSLSPGMSVHNLCRQRLWRVRRPDGLLYFGSRLQFAFGWCLSGSAASKQRIMHLETWNSWRRNTKRTLTDGGQCRLFEEEETEPSSVTWSLDVKRTQLKVNTSCLVCVRSA